MRVLTLFLAMFAALAIAVQTLLFLQHSHPVLILGVAGAVAAAAILVRVSRTGQRPAGHDRIILAIGLIAPVAAVAIALHRDEDGPGTKDFALRTAMRSDLRNLVAAEEAYLSRTSRYAATLEELGDTYRTSTGFSISLVVSGRSLHATARHAQTTKTCVVFLGPTPIAPATVEREPACTTQ